MNVNEYLKQKKEFSHYIKKSETRVYIKDPSQAPEGAQVQQGNMGGFFYDTNPQTPSAKNDSENSIKKPENSTNEQPNTDEYKNSNKNIMDSEITDINPKFNDLYKTQLPNFENGEQLADFLFRLLDNYNLSDEELIEYFTFLFSKSEILLPEEVSQYANQLKKMYDIHKRQKDKENKKTQGITDNI
jgi:hypothetical protein